jgi:hypothetical protein
MIQLNPDFSDVEEGARILLLPLEFLDLLHLCEIDSFEEETVYTGSHISDCTISSVSPF